MRCPGDTKKILLQQLPRHGWPARILRRRQYVTSCSPQGVRISCRCPESASSYSGPGSWKSRDSILQVDSEKGRYPPAQVHLCSSRPGEFRSSSAAGVWLSRFVQESFPCVDADYQTIRAGKAAGRVAGFFRWTGKGDVFAPMK